jgi:translation elongation factor EF-Tu-like GTPase
MWTGLRLRCKQTQNTKARPVEWPGGLFFRTTDVTGEVALLGGMEAAMPGDGIKLGVTLQKPIALDAGARFAIREGNRTVGSGVVTAVG